MPIRAHAMKLVRPAFGGHVNLSRPGKLGRVISHHHVDFFHDVDVGRLQCPAVAGHPVDGRLCLRIRDARHLNSIHTAGHLHHGQSRHDDLRVPSITDPGRLRETLLGKTPLNLRRVRFDNGRVGLYVHFRSHRPDLQRCVDTANLRRLEHDVIGHENFEPGVRQS